MVFEPLQLCRNYLVLPFIFEWFAVQTVAIDNYGKDGGPGVVRLLCSFYHEDLRSLIVKEV